LIRSGALLALDGEDVLIHFRFLYPKLAAARVPAEAMQYTEATSEKLRAHGISSAQDADRMPKSEKTDTLSVHFDKNPSAKESPKAETNAVSEEVWQLLEPRQRELYDMIPDGTFSLDHLTAQGISSGEAAATLTVLEMYGILVSCPGGTYRKQ
jgi:hypothetical protein